MRTAPPLKIQDRRGDVGITSGIFVNDHAVSKAVRPGLRVVRDAIHVHSKAVENDDGQMGFERLVGIVVVGKRGIEEEKGPAGDRTGQIAGSEHPGPEVGAGGNIQRSGIDRTDAGRLGVVGGVSHHRCGGDRSRDGNRRAAGDYSAHPRPNHILRRSVGGHDVTVLSGETRTDRAQESSGTPLVFQSVADIRDLIRIGIRTQHHIRLV